MIEGPAGHRLRRKAPPCSPRRRRRSGRSCWTAHTGFAGSGGGRTTAGTRYSCAAVLASVSGCSTLPSKAPTGSCGLATWRTPEGVGDPLSPPGMLTMERLGALVYAAEVRDGAASHRKLSAMRRHTAARQRLGTRTLAFGCSKGDDGPNQTQLPIAGGGLRRALAATYRTCLQLQDGFCGDRTPFQG